MIKAYFAIIPTLYEGEDIEVRYSLFQEDDNIKKNVVYLEYEKPAVAGLVSFIVLLDELCEYKEEDITVILNDSPLYELLKGASTTKNGDVLRMAGRVKKKLSAFPSITFLNVTKDKKALGLWKENVEATVK